MPKYQNRSQFKKCLATLTLRGFPRLLKTLGTLSFSFPRDECFGDILVLDGPPVDISGAISSLRTLLRHPASSGPVSSCLSRDFNPCVRRAASMRDCESGWPLLGGTCARKTLSFQEFPSHKSNIFGEEEEEEEGREGRCSRYGRILASTEHLEKAAGIKFR